MANQVDFKILPSDQFNVYSPQTRSDKIITYFTLLSKLRGDILAVGGEDDPNDIVSAFYTNTGGTQTLHLVKADGSEITASQAQQVISGTLNYVSKFTSSNDIGNSQIFDDGTNVGIGTTTMNHKLELGTGGVFADYFQLDTTYSNGFVVGAISWDFDNGTADIGLSGSLKLKIGQDDVWYVKNQTGSSIAKGTAVYASGTLGASSKILITPMIANGTIPARFFLGIVAETIANGADGYVLAKGKIRNINTNAYNEGDVLWVSPTTAGALTATEPTAPNLKLPVAFVVNKGNNGVLAVRATTGTKIADASDVDYTGAVDNSFLVYDSATGVWVDEAVGIFKTIAVATQDSIVADTYDDTLTIAAGTGISLATTASTDTLTITNSAPDQVVSLTGAGTTVITGTYPSFTITSNDEFDGTVTSVATTAPITGGTITTSGTIGITQSGSASDGYLSSTDWNTFNSKEPALTKGNLTEATSSVLTITGGTNAVIGTGTTIQVAQAGASSSGYLSSTDWNTFNGKASNSFTTIAVATQSDIVADSATDTLTIAAGTGVSITTDALTDTLTISATGSGGTVTSISTTAPITGGPITGTGTIAITQSGAASDGYLSSTDWNTFNGKQNAITLTTTGNSGSATFVSSTLNIPTYTLTGLGGVPTTRTLTINGTAYDLSADRTWSVGTVTSINLTAGDRIEVSGGPVTSSGSITVTHGTATGADFTTAQDFENRVIADGGTFEALGEVAIAIGSLEDAASPTSTDYNDGFVLQNIAVDQFGHVLGVGATDLDERYVQSITAGTGISVSGSPSSTAGVITVTNNDTGSAQNIFKNIAVSGQSTIVADSNNDTLTLAAGTGISLTTNAGTDTLTITNTAATSISCFSGYSSTGITLAATGTAYDLTLDVETVKDTTIFSHSTSTNSDEVTVLAAGTYEISYSGTLYNANSDPDSAAAVVFELYKNATAIAPLNTAQTVSHVNIDNYNYINQVANSYILTLAANDVIKLSVTANYQAVGPHSPAVIFGFVAGAKNNLTIKKIG